MSLDKIKGSHELIIAEARCGVYTVYYIILSFLYMLEFFHNKKKIFYGEFPGGLVVRILGFHCCGPGSVPGRGTEIL